MGIFIQLGNGVDFGIDDTDHPDCPDQLVVKELRNYERGKPVYTTLNLGNATKERMDVLISYLERIKVHCVD